MGKIYLKRTARNIFKNTLIVLLVLFLYPSSAFAIPDDGNKGCVQTITNPAPPGTIHAYGAARAPKSDGTARVHRGLDLMLEMCLPVDNQPDCTIMMNGNSPIRRTGGYGLYARYNCGPRVEVRYAHLNGWSAGRPVNGESGAARGTGAHIHYEILIDSVRVDPQCVWGVHPNPSVCPEGLGHSPADMCDNAVLNKLKQNGLNRYTDKPGGLTSSMNVEPGVPPSSVGPGPFEKDREDCQETPPGERKSIEHEHDVDDLEGPDIPVIQPVIDPDPPEPLPPIPPVPGTPGGDPLLVPSPSDPDLVPDKVSGCAADTWTAMVNQAVMETRREDLFNKRYIVKPDSVLDYSCFSESVKTVGTDSGPIFSETNKWDNITVDLIGEEVIIKLQTKEEDNDPLFSEKDYNLERDYTQSDGTAITYNLLSTDSLDIAIDSIVGKMAKTYLENNFTHGFLADTTPVSGAVIANCNVMDAVWKAAKCKNFDGTDMFSTFEDLATKDPREFPSGGQWKCF